MPFPLQWGRTGKEKIKSATTLIYSEIFRRTFVALYSPCLVRVTGEQQAVSFNPVAFLRRGTHVARLSKRLVCLVFSPQASSYNL